jgi:hypothetical protein
MEPVAIFRAPLRSAKGTLQRAAPVNLRFKCRGGRRPWVPRRYFPARDRSDAFASRNPSLVAVTRIEPPLPSLARTINMALP